MPVNPFKTKGARMERKAVCVKARRILRELKQERGYAAAYAATRVRELLDWELARMKQFGDAPTKSR